MARKKAPTEVSRFKFNPGNVKSDRTLREDRGWLKMDVRWVITEKTAGSQTTVLGRTILPPGVGAEHSIHRHPNAEEWEYVLHGIGIKHVGDESFYVRAGDIAFCPKDTYHGLENASENEPLITVWGYTGAPSLEKAGYIIPEDEAEPKVRQKTVATKRKPRTTSPRTGST